MIKSSSKRQLANRANAMKSTGPRTRAGKARSSQNSRKHGFAAADYTVVRLEDIQTVANLKADLIAVYHPVNFAELYALEDIAIAQEARRNLARLERGLLTMCINDTITPDALPRNLLNEDVTRTIEVTRGQNRNHCLAVGFNNMTDTKTWTLFLRYQAQAERLYRRAIEEFERLRALRSQLPNEAIVEVEPLAEESVIDRDTNPLIADPPDLPPLPQPPPNEPKRFDPHAPPPDSPRVPRPTPHPPPADPPSCGKLGKPRPDAD